MSNQLSSNDTSHKYTNTEVEIYNHESVQDTTVLIPQYISRCAFYSATGFILPNCILAYVFDYQCRFVLFAMLYTFTMLHWNKVKRDGIIRTVDIMFAYLCTYRFTFIDRYRLCPTYQTYWLYVFYTMIIAFIINEYILYMQVVRGYPYSTESQYKYKVYTQWPLRLLNYTQPNTKERENAYYRSTYVHMFFFHVLHMATSGSFAILSYYQCPTPAPGA
jgi:hypothetical protein